MFQGKYPVTCFFRIRECKEGVGEGLIMNIKDKVN